MPNPLQLAVLAETTMPAVYLAGPPPWLQEIGFKLLAGFGRLLGYRAAYPQYGVLTPEGLR